MGNTAKKDLSSGDFHVEIVTRVAGGWAHAQRKFFEAQAKKPKTVRVMLKLSRFSS